LGENAWPRPTPGSSTYTSTGGSVRNDIASISVELSKLKAQQALMIRGRAEYNVNMARIRKLREIISRHNPDL